MRARFVAVAAALSTACAAERTARRVHAEADAAAAARALAEEFVAEYFARFPEWATLAGYPGADHGRLTDNSAEGFRAWREREDALVARARALAGAPEGTPEWAALETARAVLEGSIAMRACRAELWAVSAAGPMPTSFVTGGWAGTLAMLSETQPVGSPAARRDAIARLRAYPRFVENELDNLREGIRLGYAAARGTVRRTVGELDAMLATPVAEWPTLALSRRDPAPGFRDEILAATAALLPVARRYRELLATEYRPRTSDGVLTLPDGAACYRAAILEGTTLGLTPEELHALGLERLAALRAEMQAVAERSFATSDVAALYARLDRSPEFRYASRDEIVARAERAVVRARAALSKAFTRSPRGAAAVRPYPDAQAQAGAPAMATGVWSGDRYDGMYFINTWAPERRARIGDEALAFHETYPGHILQTALTLEGGGSGLPTRYLLVNASYEGWALYAERLADELELYSSDADRLGLLRSEAFRAARLVADTGLHALGWPAERAARVLADAAFREPADVAAEVDRYCAWPGQALGYMVGALEIRALRASAEGALGPAFDLRAFHDAVIADGNVSLRVLRANVERWIEASR